MCEGLPGKGPQCPSDSPRLGLNLLELERYKEAFEKFDQAGNGCELVTWMIPPSNLTGDGIFSGLGFARFACLFFLFRWRRADPRTRFWAVPSCFHPGVQRQSDNWLTLGQSRDLFFQQSPSKMLISHFFSGGGTTAEELNIKGPPIWWTLRVYFATSVF